MRLIDGDSLADVLTAISSIKVDTGRSEEWAVTVNAARQAIAQMPTIEQTEIIRCKDCGKQPVCRFSQFQGNDGYCGLAERKGER